MTQLAAMLSGFGLGMGLIVAIGAQNAFVLRQGLRSTHTGPVVAFCIASDVLLVVVGVAGVGTTIRAWPPLEQVMQWLGATFLLGYGLIALARVVRPGFLTPRESGDESLHATLATAAAVTWLNPHVYLDTVLVVGTVSATYGAAKWSFAVGVAVASAAWFMSLGFGARRLAPLFARPVAWRVLDLFIAAVMLTIASSLVMSAMGT